MVTASSSAGSTQTSSSEVGPAAAAGPARRRVRAALRRVLASSGKGARIRQLVKHVGYPFSFTAPSAGRLVISWYLVPKGTRLAKAKKPVLVTTVSVVSHKVGKAKIKIVLTGAGRKL